MTVEELIAKLMNETQDSEVYLVIQNHTIDIKEIESVNFLGYPVVCIIPDPEDLEFIPDPENLQLEK